MPLITTTGDIISQALRTAGIIGVGQTASAEDANTGLDLLIEIAELWNRETFMCWRDVEVIIPSTGAQSYPLPDRPARLDSAYARLLVGQPQAGFNNAGLMDFPLVIIDSQSDYNTISLKQLTTFPAAIWYLPDYPTGSVFPWPIPPAGQFDLHVFYRYALPHYATLTDPLGLPPEYIRALRYELAGLLQVNYGLPGSPSIAVALAGTLATIKAANAHISEMLMPGALTRRGGGSGGISGAVGPHQSVIVLDSGLPVLG